MNRSKAADMAQQARRSQAVSRRVTATAKRILACPHEAFEPVEEGIRRCVECGVHEVWNVHVQRWV